MRRRSRSCATATRLLVLAVAAIASLAAAPVTAQERSAALLRTASDASKFAPHVAEAARRFRLPEVWLWRIMRIESAGDPSAVSRKGAMGLMQIMPETWRDMRSRYGLGDDPFDPRDNVFAGAAYLRELYDRFGEPGCFAAYNAGPKRYEDHLLSGRPLPAETVAYVGMLDASGAALMQPRDTAQTDAWRHGALFVARVAPASASAEPPTQASDAQQRSVSFDHELFVAPRLEHR